MAIPFTPEIGLMTVAPKPEPEQVEGVINYPKVGQAIRATLGTTTIHGVVKPRHGAYKMINVAIPNDSYYDHDFSLWLAAGWQIELLHGAEVYEAFSYVKPEFRSILLKTGGYLSLFTEDGDEKAESSEGDDLFL